MDEGEVIKLEITKVREYQDLTRVKVTFILDDFTTISKGDAFRVRNVYKFDNWKAPAYLISYYNSFRLGGGHSEPGPYRPRFRASLYWGGYFVFQSLVPDSIILPLTLPYRVADLVFHDDIKIESVPEFNRKYLLQSVDKAGIVKILSVELFDIIQKFEDLHIEIRNSRCLVYFPRPPIENDGLIFLEIMQELIEIDNVDLH